MAYKFQIGAATLSGSVTFKEAGVFSSGLSAGDASISNVNNIAVDTISADGSSIQLQDPMDLNSQALTNADINTGDIAADVVINKSPVITLGGDLTGNATLSNLGNATLTATIAANAVEASMLNSNVLSGSANGLNVNADGLAVKLSGSASGLAIDAGGLTIDANPDTFLVDGNGLQLDSNVAGAGLGLSGGVLSVGVDDSSVEISSDSLRVKANGVTNAMLAGSIVDSKLSTIATANKVSGTAIQLATQSAIEDSSGLKLKAATAGDGLAISAGQVLSINVDDSSVEINSDSLRVKAGGITNAMLADDAVGADELASDAVVNASVASNAAILASKINFNTDLGGNISFGNQADDDVTFGGGVVVAGNLTVQGSTTTVDSTTINISSSFTFEGPADDHETILTCGTPTQDNTLTLPQFSGSAEGVYHIPVLADATTAASALVTAAEFALLDGGSTVGTAALADADGFMHNDDGTMKQTQVIKIAELAFSKVSGDAVIASGGALTIAANAVEGSMLNNNIVSGLTDIGAAIADTDEMIVSDNGTIRRTDMSRLKTFIGNGTTALNGIGDADATLAIGLNYASANTSTGRTWTLPASPSLGESVRIKAAGVQSGAITIARAGSQTIDGNLTSIILESDNAAVELVYVASDDWRVF